MPRLLLVEQNAVSLAGHYFAHTRALAKAGRKAGLPVTILQNVVLQEKWRVSGVIALPVFSKDCSVPDTVTLQPWGAGNIAYEFAAAGLTSPGDERVVFGTLGFAELLQLLALFTDDPRHLDSRHVHLVLRYDVEMLRDNLAVFRRYFDRIAETAILRRRILLHADTEALCRVLRQLTGLAVSALPVISDQMPAKRAGRAGRTGRLVAAYLGDAREEKNYGWLPPAVAWLWPGYIRTERLAFMIQSNLNRPGGGPGVLTAAQALGRYDPAHVRLLPAALGPAEYRQALEAADLVLVAYDAYRYRHRSSGILVEAMAAGKPVVTTAGSWMAERVDRSHAVLIEGACELGPAIARIVDDYPRYAAAARSVASRALATGDALLRALLAALPTPGPMGPRVLFVASAEDIATDASVWAVTQARIRGALQAGYAASLLVLDAAPVAFARARRLGLGAGADHIMLGSDRAGCIDVLKGEPVLAVWLSRAGERAALAPLGLVALPVIAAFDELECMHRAVREGRLIDEDARAREYSELRACSRLACVSSATAELMRRSVGHCDAAIVPLVARDGISRTLLLAGACDLGELAGQSGLDANVEALRALGQMTSLDMVLVAGPDTIEGAVCFVDQIFRPLLSPLGFNLLVIGPADRLEATVGLVVACGADRLDRLHAAAKLAIAPHGVDVEGIPHLVDALGMGLPVIAADDETPVAMGARIITLLSSARLRQEYALTTYGSGRVEAMQSALDELLRPMLPEVRLGGSGQRDRGMGGNWVEWGALIQAANQAVRDHLAGHRLNDAALAELARHDRTEVAELLRMMVKVAPDGEPGDERALLVALDVHLGSATFEESTIVAAYSSFPLKPALANDVGCRTRVPRYFVRSAERAQTWQVIPLRPDGALVLGCAIVASERGASEGPLLLLREGERARLNLPAILATGPAQAWVDLTADRDAQLRIELAGRALEATVSVRSDLLSSYFVHVPMPADGLLALDVICLSGQVILFEARSGVAIGERAPEREAGADPAHELVVLGTAMLARLAQEADRNLVLACRVGRPGQPAALRRLQRDVRHKKDGTAEGRLRALMSERDLRSFVRSQETVDTLLAAALPREMLGDTAFSFVAASGLSVEVAGVFSERSETPACSMNGVALEELGPRRWFAPGRPGGIFAHRLTFSSSGQAVRPQRVVIGFRLPAALDPETRDACLDRTGFHMPEYAEGKPDYIWTGPNPSSRIDLPVAALRSGRVTLRLVHLGHNEERDDFFLQLNGQTLPHELRDIDGARHVEATFAGDPYGTAVCSLRLTVRHVFSSQSEPRTLGVAIKEILLEMTL